MFKRKASMIVVAAFCAITCSNWACTSSQETQAAQLADGFAHSISAAHAAVDAAHAAGKIDDASYQAILKDFLEADQGGLDLNSLIRGIAAGTSTTDQVNTVIQSIESALTDGTAHISDPTTLAEVKAAAAAVNTTLTQIEVIYKITQGGTNVGSR